MRMKNEAGECPLRRKGEGAPNYLPSGLASIFSTFFRLS